MTTQFSRRKFLVGASAVAAASMLPFSSCASSEKQTVNNALTTPDGKPNSKFNGVQIGAISYSFRSMATTSDEVIAGCVGAGLSSIELWHNFESEMGAPTNPVVRQRGDRSPLTPEETAATEKYNADLAAFRKDPETFKKLEAINQKFAAAGIEIHTVKWSLGNDPDTLDYTCKVAQAFGAKGICKGDINEQDCKDLGAAAERNGLVAVFHNHGQYANLTIEEVDRLISLSPANRFNYDFGHYVGFGYANSTKLTPMEFIDKYADRMYSVHLKDKTRFENEAAKGVNQVWGQGETPLREVLQQIRDKYPQIYCDIELEYPIAAWSDAIKETAKCVRHAREILI